MTWASWLTTPTTGPSSGGAAEMAEALRQRLLSQRRDLVERLAAVPADQLLEPGFLRMLADTEAALTAVERIAEPSLYRAAQAMADKSAVADTH